MERMARTIRYLCKMPADLKQCISRQFVKERHLVGCGDPSIGSLRDRHALKVIEKLKGKSEEARILVESGPLLESARRERAPYASTTPSPGCT